MSNEVQDMAAMKLSFTWFGVRKTLTDEQKAEAAEGFGAEGEFLSAGKRLINTKDERYRACTSIRSQLLTYWRSVSLPFPEDGVRLLLRSDVESVISQLRRHQAALDSAVVKLDEALAEVIADARRRLGRLFNASDYPSTMLGLFNVGWEFVNVEAPAYLRQLSPRLYESECRRVQARFDEAVSMAEDAFLQQVSDMVSHLTERLSGSEDGKPKVFRATAVDNLQEFFRHFRHMNIRSNNELNAAIDRAEQVLEGVPVGLLRTHDELRQEVASQLSVVQASLDGLLVDKPRRNIRRSTPATAPTT